MKSATTRAMRSDMFRAVYSLAARQLADRLIELQGAKKAHKLSANQCRHIMAIEEELVAFAHAVERGMKFADISNTYCGLLEQAADTFSNVGIPASYLSE